MAWRLKTVYLYHPLVRLPISMDIEESPACNMIQAQRDYFGAHTYERIDKEGIFHTDWLKA